jgi:hypothetical protein
LLHRVQEVSLELLVLRAVREREVRRDLKVPRVIVASSACKVFLELR